MWYVLNNYGPSHKHGRSIIVVVITITDKKDYYFSIGVVY